MANKWAITNGNWSDGSTWNDGIIPSNGDIVYANGKTVQFNNNINIGNGWLRNDANTELGVVSGGLFSSTSGSNTEEVTANIYGCNNVVCLYLGTDNVKTVNGNLESDETGAVVRFDSSSIGNVSGKLVVNGNVFGRIDNDTFVDAAKITVEINGNWDARTSTYIFNKVRTNWYAGNGTYIIVHGIFHVYNNTNTNISNIINTQIYITLFDKFYIDNQLRTTMPNSQLRLVGLFIEASILLSFYGFSINLMNAGPNSIYYNFDGQPIMIGINKMNYPTEINVANGVKYGSNEQFTGTLQLPQESAVLKGYKYGDRTGTLEVSGADENTLLKIFKKAFIWFENRHEKHLKIT